MMQKVVENLIALNKTIATMESCTGGGVANALTNIPGSSEVFHFGAVTYSNDYKVKMGVPKDVIDTYSVYSMETAIAMSHTILDITGADYGIGVTGKLCKSDPQNPEGRDDLVYINIYVKDHQKDYGMELQMQAVSREEQKNQVIQAIAHKLEELLEDQ